MEGWQCMGHSAGKTCGWCIRIMHAPVQKQIPLDHTRQKGPNWFDEPTERTKTEDLVRIGRVSWLGEELRKEKKRNAK